MAVVDDVARANRLRRELVDLLKKMPYQRYLLTDHWQAIREAAVRRALRSCQLCDGDGPLHVHHRTYARRGEERAEDVVCLCQICHEAYHGREAPG